MEIPSDVAKDLVLPKTLVDHARSDPSSVKSVRNVLRSDILVARSRRSLGDSDDALQAARDAPVCPQCAQPIRRGESMFQHEQIFHIVCHRP